MSPYKKVFLVRFLSYFIVFVGVLSLAFEFGPLAVSEFNYRKNLLLGKRYVVDPMVGITPAVSAQPQPSEDPSLGFGNLPIENQNVITPMSTDYGIVIEKINANAKVIADIDPGNEREYGYALTQGVVAAKGSTAPGENGNLFIFSHSADAPWNIVRFNAVFYLLRELEAGDKILVFYQGKRYDYIVFDKKIVNPADTSFLANRYDKPVLTLQTCDPPGTLLNRLIVRAKLANS